MKKTVKKFLLSCLTVACICAVSPVTVQAQTQRIALDKQVVNQENTAYLDAKTEGNYKYVVEDGKAILTKYIGKESEVTVPAKIGGYSVKKLDANVFTYDNSPVSITFSEGIEELEWGWAYECFELEKIHYSSTVRLMQQMQEDVYYVNPMYCPEIKSITVAEKNPYMKLKDGDVYSKDEKVFIFHPTGDTKEKVVIQDGVTEIADYAFAANEKIKEIVMPNTVEYIRIGAFHKSTVGKVNISTACKYIDVCAFSNSAIRELYIPASVEGFYESALDGTAELKKITVDASNSYYCVKNNMLYEKQSNSVIGYPGGLTEEVVNIPEGTERIGSWTFADIGNMKELVLPDSLVSIGGAAFLDCYNLTKVILPRNVEVIETCAFLNCKNLKKVIFCGDAPRKMDEDIFRLVESTAYYPAGNTTWTKEKLQSYGGKITWVASKQDSEAPAKPNKITNVVSGVHVYWKAVEGVNKYGLWRSENGKNGTYKWIANPTVPHFTDTKVESGKTYFYKVTAMDLAEKKHSEKSEAIGITYVATPDISSRVNKAAGIELGWKKVNGATGYGIYRKSFAGTDAWVRVGTVEGNSTFKWTDTSVKNNNGIVYKYTIRALTGSDRKTLSGCRNTGRTMARLTSRTLADVEKINTTAVKCSWTTSAAVTGYEVRFMVGTKVYKTYAVGDFKIGAKMFTGLKAGQTYKVQVRSCKKVDGVGIFYSAWSAAKNVEL